MAITFILNDEAVNDQTTGLQTDDNVDDVFLTTAQGAAAHQRNNRAEQGREGLTTKSP